MRCCSRYTKLDLKAALLDPRCPTRRFARRGWTGYFPDGLSKRFAEHLHGHPLRRQIIATELVNEIVNRGGVTYACAPPRRPGPRPAELARAFAVACGVFDLPGLWRRIDSHGGLVRTAVLNSLRAEVLRLLDRATRWFLQTRGGTLDVPVEVAALQAGVGWSCAGRIPNLLVGAERERLQRRIAEFADAGAPADLAADVAALLDVFSLLDIIEVSERAGEDLAVVAPLYFTISERFEIDRFLGADQRPSPWGPLGGAGPGRAARGPLRGAGAR